MPKTTVVITTINIPIFVDGICENINKYKHDDVNILIIGDKKTPNEVGDYCKKTEKKHNIEIEYLDIEGQLLALSKFQELLNLFPYNTPDRTMLGGMLSYIRNSERIIAIDDDNYVTECDFIGAHKIVGRNKKINLISNDLQWFNVHSALIEESNIPFYPRGYPWKKRVHNSNEKNVIEKAVRVVVNQGLVLEDPDIDAISRLFFPIRAIGMSNEFDQQFGLDNGTWSPFNYQNTALIRELIPCYYRPLSTSRNADIWTAYVFNKLAHHFEDIITFGYPLVKQIRNEHDLWDDLDIELINNRATDPFISLLREIDLTKDNYFDALKELLEKSYKTAKQIYKNKTKENEMILNFFLEYNKWCDVVEKII